MPTATWCAAPRASTERQWRSKLFGYSEEQIAQFGLSVGVTAFMLYMLFIILQLARESKAGKFGTFVLFLVLGFGLLGFLAKNLIAWFLNI